MDSRRTSASRRAVRGAPPRALVALLAAAALLGPASAVPAQVREAAAEVALPQEPWTPPPLFAEQGVLTLTIRTDLRALVADRDSVGRSRHAATVLLHGAGGRVDTMAARLRTRGHFRRQARICDFPPLQVEFTRGMRGTPFARQEAVKLVTRCQAKRDDYEQYILQEYAAYRVLNALTPRSFGVRLARITYEDTTRRHPGLTTYAFFIEPEKDLARRLGGRQREEKNASLHDLDSTQTHVVGLFQYLAGNTDWDIRGLHNIVLVQAGDSAPDAHTIYPVPYDFDWTGLVNARYAFPDGRLPIKTVRDRLWRGHCVRAADLQPAIAHVTARRAAIHAAVDSVPALEPRTRAGIRSYVDDFFKLIAEPRSLQRQIDVKCVPP